MLYALGDLEPQTEGDAYWTAPTAAVIGDVVLGRNVSVWWSAVLRGDNDRITVGENTNIQDGSTLHVDPGFPLTVGRDVTVGHMVMLHGCTIGDGCLIGIGAIILNGVSVGRNCLIGANTFLPEGKEIPDNSVVIGAPGKVVREATDKDRAIMARPVPGYVRRWPQYRDTLRPLGLGDRPTRI